MEQSIEMAQRHAQEWLGQYGYHAVAPALLIDPAGVPWAWIFLMLLAEHAGLNIPFLMLYGFAIVTLCDHALYCVGARGGRALVARWSHRFPRLGEALHSAENAVRGRGVWAVALGRYLPLIGRWVALGAGLAGVPYARFALFDAIGVALTVFGFGLAAHLIGRETLAQPWFHEAVLVLFVAGTALTILWLAWQWLRRKNAGA